MNGGMSLFQLLELSLGRPDRVYGSRPGHEPGPTILILFANAD